MRSAFGRPAARVAALSLLVGVAAFGLPQIALAVEGDCTDFDAAEVALFRVTTWAALREWHDGFPSCDDGYLGEHVSELVTATFATDWENLAAFEREAEGHTAFHELVIAHVDATANLDNLDAIVDNATARCPAASGALCQLLAAAAKAALAEAEEAAGNGLAAERLSSRGHG